MLQFYNPDGELYTGTLEEVMAQIFKDVEDPEKKIVKQDRLDNGLFISTVWLECTIKFLWSDEKPKIYETMVFFAGSRMECQRYETRDDADRGHTEMLKKYINWTPDDLTIDRGPENDL